MIQLSGPVSVLLIDGVFAEHIKCCANSRIIEALCCRDCSFHAGTSDVLFGELPEDRLWNEGKKSCNGLVENIHLKGPRSESDNSKRL